jgi:serine/threonine protein kinase
MPGYTIEKLLGRGGMGAVYRGVQTNLDRPVAIKILPPGVEKEDPSFAERFKSEARLMARLSNPAVVGVFDFGTNSGGQMYFAMEYVDGSDVSQMIATQGKLPPEHALAITAHVCDALSAAHELGIVHRDIKPANVLINMKGQVKVADFGLAKIEDPGQHGLTKTGYAMGTPDFVAPEALTLGAAIDGRADLYAVGVMLYQMLTGNIPRGAFKPASVLVPGLDPRFDPIILKAMQHDRAERHQSAAELRRELDVILTVPFVRNDAPASAAIPVAQMAQAPGQRSAAQKPQPWSAGAPTRQPSVKAGEGTRAPETPSKSKTPLFIGLGVAAAIGIGAFVMMGGKKEAKQSGPLNRSAAEIASQGLPEGRAERGNPLSGTSVPPQATKPAQGTVRTTISPPEPAKPQPKPAPTPVSSSPSLPISASSDKFPPGQWVKVFAKFEDLPEKVRMTGSDLKYEDGWIKLRKDSDNYITLAPELTTNYAVRARLRADTMAKLPGTLTLRRASSTTFYQIGVGRSNGLSVMKLSGGIYTMLANDPAKKQPQPGAEYVIEAAVIGQHIVSRFNGATPLLFVNDTSYGNGNAAVTGSEDVRDIEVINLDGLTEAEALKILGVDEKGNDLRQTAPVAATSPVPSTPKSPTLPASPSGTQFPPGQWVKVFTKFEDLPENLRKPNSGMRWENGTLEAANEIYLGKIPSLGAMKSCAMRFVVSKDAAIQARMRDKNDKAYYSISTTSLNRWNPQSINGSLKSLAQFTLPDSPGPIRKYEFAMVGTRLVVRSDNDHILASLVDDQIDQGDILFGKLKGIMRDIEVINLDGLPEAEALKHHRRG